MRTNLAPSAALPNYGLARSSVSIREGTLGVVRDDLLFGGTKQRAAVPFLQKKKAEGYREFVYASPFCGFAQVALAAAGKAVGVKIVLFCEPDAMNPTPFSPHAFTRLAAEQGAEIHLVATLAAAEAEAKQYEERGDRCYKVPLGFDCPCFREALRRELSLCWNALLERSEAPKALWVAAGSGTIGQVLRDVLPDSVLLRLVDVGVLPPDDLRLRALRARKQVAWMRSPESFYAPAGFCPPVPSNVHYDAKLWRFLWAEAQDGDVWWNIAR